ncbi:MAG: hypothetical protein HQL97_00510 [Magnetococcales bacterium]|nr:hypothetical protein [Magnetococcales bacterium]
MKVRFYCDFFRPLYVTPPTVPFLMAYTCPAMKSQDATRVSFEVEIPDELIKLHDVEAAVGPVTTS